jgi:hypothetical protein
LQAFVAEQRPDFEPIGLISEQYERGPATFLMEKLSNFLATGRDGDSSPVPFRAKDLLVCPEMQAGFEYSL